MPIIREDDADKTIRLLDYFEDDLRMWSFAGRVEGVLNEVYKDLAELVVISDDFEFRWDIVAE